MQEGPSSRSSPGTPRSAVAGACLAILSACSAGTEESEPVWIRLAAGLHPRAAEEGALVDGIWRVTLGPLCAEGIPLAPGTSEELEVDLPPRAALSFALARAAPGDGRFRVTLDGAEVFAQELAGTTGTWHRVDLPERGGRARLAFSFEARAGRGAFLQPTIGPRLARVPGAAAPRRRDVILFLADTFRADLLRAYGAEQSLAPALDALAARATVFECRSSATWTLPAVSSLFTALAPPQHGAFHPELALDPAAVTLAEQFGRSGYRTAAITDSVYVSRRHGLDQGFQWFEEMPSSEWDLTHTLARALELVERDDGRPLLLLVHTYRTHKPLRVGTREDPGPWRQALAEAEAAARAAGAATLDEWIATSPQPFRELYLEAARGLDAELGPWLAELEARGHLRDALFVFTSDHGEAFGEHGEIWHRGRPWETEARVPLFILGPGLARGPAPRLASLVDLPRTLAALCAVPPEEGWGGEALFDAQAPGRAFAFRMSGRTGRDRPNEVALYSGRRKVFATLELLPEPRTRVRRAFDLALDPREEQDVWKGGAGEDWPRALHEELRSELERLSVRALAPPSIELDPAALQELGDLGYAGDDH